MALVLADRVLETTTTTGSGTITLAGAEPGYQSFSVVGNANQTYYTIAGDTQWEVGIGTYTSSGTTLSRDTVLSSSAGGAKVTFSAGSKKVFVTYPSEKSVNFGVSGNISASSGVITDVGYPSADSDAATKLYVDNMSAAALHVHEAVVLTTPGSTGRADTYNNGTAGVSATLTATANGTLVIDSTVAQSAQRVLIKDCTNQVQNGIYVVTTVGTASTPYVMTRSSDADTYGEGGSDSLDLGSYFFTTGGTTQKGAAYVCNTPGVIVFGSTAITFAEFSQAQVYSAGNGISITLGSIALNTPVTVASGGTGLTTSPTNGQLLIGNGSNYTLSTLTAGSGVSITNSAGSITLSATGLGGTVTAVTASGPLASSGGTTPNISVANSTGTGSVVLDQGATISSATITAAVSASITTITGTSANITTVTGTTTTFSSGTISQLGATSATIATLSGTNVTYSSGTVSQLAATSATIATVSGTNVTYSNGNLTSATVTTVSGTNLSYGSATITTGNLAFTSTAQRITGDMSNATHVNRLSFQSSVTNGATSPFFIPNGTGTTASVVVANASDPTNCSFGQFIVVGTTDVRVNSGILGTGTYLPMTFYTNGSERVRIDTSGRFGINLTPSTATDAKLQVTGGTTNATSLATAYSAATVAIVPKSTSGYSAAFASGTSDFPLLQVSANGAAAGDFLLQPYGGNVGIGKTPTTILDVSGTITGTALSGTTITGTSGTITNLNSTSANITTLTGTTFGTTATTQLRGASADITTLTGTTFGTTATTQLRGASAQITTLTATSSNITTLSGTTATYTSATVTNLNSTSANITTLTGTTFGTTGTTQLRGASAQITTISATTIGSTTGTTVNASTINVTTTGTTINSNGDIYAVRSGGTTGVIFLGSSGTRYLYFDGSNYHLATNDLYIKGVQAVVNSGNWSINSSGFTSTSQNSQFNSVGVGTAGSGTAGEIRATNNVTAYYSDARLKDFKGKIGDALYKVSQLNGYYYTENEKAEEFGFNNKELQVGVSAQEVKAILPEVIAPAPFDMDAENKSKSGEDYMTVRYEKLVPLLIEAIKELKAEVEALKAAK